MPGRIGGRHLPKFVIWMTLVLICFGLGYPTLNRYDPRQLLPDAATYGKLAQAGPGDIPSPFRFRILVPYLAHAIAVLAKGHTGTWDPLLFGFLVVNSIFVATTSFLSYIIGRSLLGNSSTALFASALYLLNFAVSNGQFAALVDSDEALFLMALVVSMFYGRWLLLPLFGVLARPTSRSRCSFRNVDDCSGVRSRDCVAVPDFRASGLSLGFCLDSQHAYELRVELCSFVPESEFLVHRHLASSPRAGANSRIPTPVVGGRWGGDGVCAGLECVPQF